MSSAQEAFRRLTIGEPRLLGELTDSSNPAWSGCHLDGRTEALLRVAALIALDAQPSSYRPAIEAAQRMGARLEDLLATLVAIAPTVGTARVVSAAPRIALAAGYDVEAALE